jgi:hypothetical protein
MKWRSSRGADASLRLPLRSRRLARPRQLPRHGKQRATPKPLKRDVPDQQDFAEHLDPSEAAP